jgi:Mor family transcriptional regulator
LLAEFRKGVEKVDLRKKYWVSKSTVDRICKTEQVLS